MIEQIKKIPVTEDSHPFAHAAPRCRFHEIGYEEDEYFLYGTAHVYEETEDKGAVIIFENAPYVNRMLVRRPKDITKFSGNVIVEMLNPSAFYDIDRMWVEAWHYFVRHGDLYIGLTSKSDVLDALYRLDPQRYTPLSWKNPLPGRKRPKSGLFPVLEEYENGLLWDMLTDLSCVLRTENAINPIAEYGRPYLYLTGWSQCGSFMVRYRKTFADEASRKIGQPVFDGYMHAGAGCAFAPINSFTESPGFWDTPENFSGIIESAEPYMVLNTETETPYTRWSGDSDEPGALFRVYEIAGSSHDSKYNLLDYYEEDDDPAKLGLDQPYYGLEPYPQDYPYEYIFAAAFRNLFTWVRESVPAPPSLKVERYLNGESKKDAFGNTRGGVRTPFIDLPTCVYSKYCTLKEDPAKQRDFWGHVEPFPPEFLTCLYQSLDQYKGRVAERTEELIAQGYLLNCDKEAIIQTAVQFAKERGLE